LRPAFTLGVIGAQVEVKGAFSFRLSEGCGVTATTPSADIERLDIALAHGGQSCSFE
jgi:hypothetical protein